jgi:DNA-3-methyladenine glycosylase I
MTMIRCTWAKSPVETVYHDEEWGTPVTDDIRLFEFLVLETAQAGLSWITILKKREGYRKAFAGFDPHLVSQFGQSEVEALLRDSGIIRNRRKIESTVVNAKAFLKVQDAKGSFSAYLWSFVDGRPVINEFRQDSELPAKTALSEKLSADMKKRGFRFVGPTSCYAYLQSVGLVNDHTIGCFRYRELVDEVRGKDYLNR